MVARTLGEEIRAIRNKRGFSQRNVADATAYNRGRRLLSDSGLQRIESGTRADPHLSTLLPVCEVLDIEIHLTPEGVRVIDLQEEE